MKPKVIKWNLVIVMLYSTALHLLFRSHGGVALIMMSSLYLVVIHTAFAFVSALIAVIEKDLPRAKSFLLAGFLVPALGLFLFLLSVSLMPADASGIAL